MDISTRLNMAYPTVQSLPPVSAPVPDRQAVKPQVVNEATASADADTAKSKNSDEDKNSKQLQAAVKEMEKFFQSVRRNLEFSIDEGSGQVVVKVIATETGEVVRQLPSAEALKIADSLKNANSLLFDAKV
ncbi:MULTISPECIES: flagellar protein FlaG [unclassified Pseudomonas]|uniref:flagellar protein FlaG n=1 Tax=unclassified Pseudomonas TaxID=196821 RepID=UPI000D394DC6|nr:MULTISPECIES: flagellar protein FlaG [unclassified Pseudomonas]RAU40677.1 flagellar biosynthesis protein FlaG [Pseudomonas sp. RIT 409]RAU47773.1 flagellar biosynthesis protein FlaG [Pseudomonas sp. RIT 412]